MSTTRRNRNIPTSTNTTVFGNQSGSIRRKLTNRRNPIEDHDEVKEMNNDQLDKVEDTSVNNEEDNFDEGDVYEEEDLDDVQEEVVEEEVEDTSVNNEEESREEKPRSRRRPTQPTTTRRRGQKKQEEPSEESVVKRRNAENKPKDIPSRILTSVKEIIEILEDKTLDVNARKNIEKRLKEYESSTANTEVVMGISKIASEIFSYAWDTPKKKPVYINTEVHEFLKAADFGTAYDKSTVKGKVSYEEIGNLSDLLYTVSEGVSNVVILNQLAKLYVILNPEIKLPIPEGKKTPQTAVRADDLMKEYLGNIMEDMTNSDIQYNAELEGKNVKNKTPRKEFDPENIPRQRFSKLFTVDISDYEDVMSKKEVIEKLKKDEILIRDTIQYHESVLRKEKEKVKKEQ